jgi:hypothetical protein
METKKVKLSALRLNPDNPRIIKDEKFKKLVKSILTFPKMLELREIVTDETMMVLGGNMRFRALQHIAKMTEQELRQQLKSYDREELTDYWIAWHDCPMETVKIGIGLTDAEKEEFIDKDNLSYGEWDWESLANRYDIEVLQDWGHDVPIDWGNDASEEKEMSETEKLSNIEVNENIYYEPTEKPNLKLEDCCDLTKFNKKTEFIDSLNLSPQKKDALKMFAYRFIKIDFESVANYYAFNATEEEKKAIERLRLVLVDGGGKRIY